MDLWNDRHFSRLSPFVSLSESRLVLSSKKTALFSVPGLTFSSTENYKYGHRFGESHDTQDVCQIRLICLLLNIHIMFVLNVK